MQACLPPAPPTGALLRKSSQDLGRSRGMVFLLRRDSQNGVWRVHRTSIRRQLQKCGPLRRLVFANRPTTEDLICFRLESLGDGEAGGQACLLGGFSFSQLHGERPIRSDWLPENDLRALRVFAVSKCPHRHRLSNPGVLAISTVGPCQSLAHQFEANGSR